MRRNDVQLINYSRVQKNVFVLIAFADDPCAADTDLFFVLQKIKHYPYFLFFNTIEMMEQILCCNASFGKVGINPFMDFLKFFFCNGGIFFVKAHIADAAVFHFGIAKIRGDIMASAFFCKPDIMKHCLNS